MKKLLVVLVVLGGLGYLGYRYWIRTDLRACERFAKLCGDKGQDAESIRARCEQHMDELGKSGGNETKQKSSRCVLESESCAAAAGCVAGGMIDGMKGAMQDFLKGMEKGLQR